MRIVDLTTILVGDRQRKTMDKTKLADLKTSIISKGLMHPIVVNPEPDGETFSLIAGERRLTAIQQLAADKVIFRHHGEFIIPGQIPITYLTDLSDDERFEAELEENYLREDLTWQERVTALASLHQRRKAVNPEQTIKQTATELSDLAGGAPNTATETLRQKIADASIIAPHLLDPAIAKARNEKDAVKIVLQRAQEKYEADLIRKKVAKPTTLDISLRQGDLHDVLPSLDANQFDLILSDPPYGLNASADGYRARTVLHHNYDDTPENARQILRTILTEGWRVSKLKANIFIFTDIMHWEFLQKLSSQMGWSPWKWPVIWQKSEAEGLVPWGSKGFAHTYDIIFFATKGQRGLNGVELDILTEKRVSRSLRTHAAEKPVELLEHIIDITTLPGDRVLDPCMGSGSTLVAAKRLKRNGVGIEISAEYYNTALVRVDKAELGDSVIVPSEKDLDGMPTV